LKNHLNPTIADKGFISRPSPRIIATSVVTDRCEQNRKFDQTLSILRERNARQYAIDSVKGVDEATYVRLGGIDQWVTIRGEDRQNPVLLFVHGGPGDVTNPWSFALFAAWEKRFTVVQWDQRGAGRTLRGTGPSIESAMILDRMAQDGIELSEYLRKHLGKERIVLVAHSFGSILGLRMVQARPDLFCAYVGTGQVSDETKNYSVAYAALFGKSAGHRKSASCCRTAPHWRTTLPER
jgi:pimeloyl-ACP methyl ester carboxylesterase